MGMGNSNKTILTALAAAFVFSGCGGDKQYFESDKVYSLPSAAHSYNGEIVDISRDGATLDNGYYIGEKGVIIKDICYFTVVDRSRYNRHGHFDVSNLFFSIFIDDLHFSAIIRCQNILAALT